MPYIPKQGDIITLDFNPQAGHEQQDNRLGLVVSNYTFNRHTQMAVVCPITNKKRGFPLHIPLDDRTSTTGVVMCEQLKSLDITARKAVFKEKAPLDFVEEVTDVILSFFDGRFD